MLAQMCCWIELNKWINRAYLLFLYSLKDTHWSMTRFPFTWGDPITCCSNRDTLEREMGSIISNYTKTEGMKWDCLKQTRHTVINLLQSLFSDRLIFLGCLRGIQMSLPWTTLFTPSFFQSLHKNFSYMDYDNSFILLVGFLILKKNSHNILLSRLFELDSRSCNNKNQKQGSSVWFSNVILSRLLSNHWESSLETDF